MYIYCIYIPHHPRSCSACDHPQEEHTETVAGLMVNMARDKYYVINIVLKVKVFCLCAYKIS